MRRLLLITFIYVSCTNLHLGQISAGDTVLLLALNDQTDFSDNATVTDLSGNNRTIKIDDNSPGTLSSVDAKFGKGFSFSTSGGNGFALDASTDVFSLNANEAFSLSAWVYINTMPSSSQYIIHLLTGGTGAHALLLESSKARFRLEDASGTVQYLDYTLTTGDLNKWINLVAVYDSGSPDSLRLFKDNTEVAKAECTLSDVAATNNVRIAAAFSSGNSPFEGILDEIQIFSAAYDGTQQEVITSTSNFSSQTKQNFIFQNPVQNGLLQLTNQTNSSHSSIEIINGYGQIVMTANNFSNSLNVSQLEKGMYYMRILDQDNSLRDYQKILIQ